MLDIFFHKLTVASIQLSLSKSMIFTKPCVLTSQFESVLFSVKNRKRAAWKILDDNELGGRGRILVIQLQGHLFFGNVAQLNESVNGLLLGSDNRTTTTDQQHDSIGKVRPGQPVLMQQHRQKPWILIMDFSLVLGIDTSATQAIVKLKDVIAKTSDVTLCIFVTGSNDGVSKTI